jgi:hypothetical protein
MDIVKDTIFHSAINYKYNNYNNIQLSLYLSLSRCPHCPAVNTSMKGSFLAGGVVCVLCCVCVCLFWGAKKHSATISQLSLYVCVVRENSGHARQTT